MRNLHEGEYENWFSTSLQIMGSAKNIIVNIGVMTILRVVAHRILANKSTLVSKTWRSELQDSIAREEPWRACCKI